MAVYNGDAGAVLCGLDTRHNVKVFNSFLQFALDKTFRDQALGLLDVLRRNFFKHFQLPAGITADNAQNSRNIDAAQAAGVRNCDAFDVFDNITAAADLHMGRELTEDLPCLGRRVSDCNRLRTSKCRDQFALQCFDKHILRFLIHSVPPVVYENIFTHAPFKVKHMLKNRRNEQIAVIFFV